MDQNGLDLKVLNKVQYLLERMLELAERSASDDCRDASRAKLQKGFELLHDLLEQTMGRYQKGRTTE